MKAHLVGRGFVGYKTKAVCGRWGRALPLEVAEVGDAQVCRTCERVRARRASAGRGEHQHAFADPRTAARPELGRLAYALVADAR